MNRNKNSRLSKGEKEKIRKMTLEGKSLNQIVKLTGLGKTTIYYNVKDLKPRQWRKLIVNLNSEQIGKLIGAFAGDGSYYYSRKKNGGGNHKIRYSLCFSMDMDYAKYLIKLLKKLNLNPFISCRDESKGNKVEVGVTSKEYLEFIRKFVSWEGKRTYSIGLKNKIEDYDKDFLRGFVRGLMDTDGYIEISNVSCAVVSENLIKSLAQILDLFGLRYKLTKKKRVPPQKDIFLIRIYRDSLEKYHELFGFSNKYKLESLNKIINKKNGSTRI